MGLSLPPRISELALDGQSMTNKSVIPYHVGHRYINVKDEQPLTLRYAGTLSSPNGASSTPGNKLDTTWLGVEWDDARRGKHSGEFDGIQRYRVRQPGSGSFLRYRPANVAKGKGVEPNLHNGPTLWEAIENKYLTSPDEANVAGEEPSHRGKYREIEVPNIDKVAKRLASELRDGKLRVLDLAGSWIREKGHVERPETIDLSSVQVLDISQNLINSWEALAGLTAEMPSLRNLITNHSRLPPLSHFLDPKGQSLSQLRELHVRNSALIWSDVIHLAASLPELLILDVGSNHLIGESLVWAESATVPLLHAKMRELDLSSCRIGGDEGWRGVMEAVSGCPSLSTLYLSCNPLARIPDLSPGSDTTANTHIQSLILFPTEIKSWSSVDNLARWCPGLTELKLYPSPPTSVINPTEPETIAHPNEDPEEGNAWSSIDGDFTGDMTGGKSDRAWMIAKLKGLRMLNGTEVSSQERVDSERAYVRKIGGVKDVSEEVKGGFGRYSELRGEYEDASVAASTNTKRDLKSQMIRFNVINIGDKERQALSTVSFLPSLPLKLIPSKLARITGLQQDSSPVRASELRWDWSETVLEARQKMESTEDGNGMGIETVGKLEDVVGWAMSGRKDEEGQDWWIVVRC